MATNPIKLVFNMQSKALATFNGSASVIPALFQSNTPDFEISAINPGATPLVAFTPVDLGSFGLRMAIGPTPAGTVGPAVLALALPADWAWDSTNKKFTGSIALNTTDVDTYIGSLPEKSAYLEINLTFGATSRITLYQGPILIKAVVDELLSLVPTPVDTYMTENESKALFGRKVGLPGEMDVRVSPNGAWSRETGVDDNGTRIDNVFPT